MTLQDLVNGDIPEVLWHYTSLSTFKKIVDGGKNAGCEKPVEPVLWATDIRFLNDREEAVHAIELFRKRTKNISDEKERKLVQRILEENCDKGILSPNGSKVFVTSFSAEEDKLSQWRAYAKAPSGLALGFDLRAIRPSPPDTFRIFTRCVYKDLEKAQIVDAAINDFVLAGKQQLSRGSQQRAGSLITQLATLIPLLKHESFSEEKEWRLVIRRLEVEEKENLSKERNYRVEASGLTPYLSWPIALIPPKPDAGRRGLLTHLTVGPHPDIDLAKETVESWLSQEGISAIVEKSNTPFRSW